MPSYDQYKNATNPLTGRIKAVAYARVSTVRQAETELSLDEQLRKVSAFAEMKDADVVETFIDRGLSGRVDTRPEFQSLIRYACDPANGVKLVIVYSFSRFFRNVTSYLRYREQLEECGVKLVSATQDIPEGAAGKLLETLLAAFDGHASEVNAATVKDMMTANAEAGFWNGARPPFGYRVVDAIKVGTKMRRKLEVEPEEALVVHRIYELCTQGDGSGWMGLKKIATYLNHRSMLLRGRQWMTSDVERVLKSETYTGTAYFNKRCSRTRKPRPPNQWIAIKVPALVSRELHDAVGELLVSRRPANTAPRTVSGPTLLTGLAWCGRCADHSDGPAGMMLRTAKGGQYRYLACARRALRSTFSCDAPWLPMEKIDEAVISAVEHVVFKPERLRELVGGIVASNENGLAQIEANITSTRQALAKAESGLRKLYAMIASDPETFSVTDPELRDQINELKRQKSMLATEVDRLVDRRKLSDIDISDEKISGFAKAVGERLRNGVPAFRRAWLHHFVSDVCVRQDVVHIRMAKDRIVKGALDGDPSNITPVPSFARKWRTRHDSNL